MRPSSLVGRSKYGGGKTEINRYYIDMKVEAFRRRYGVSALVTGAAQGLGKAFALELARWGIDLLLADIQAEKLAHTAAEINSVYGVRVDALPIDLAERGAADRLMTAVRKIPDCRLFVYCAAYGPVKRFMENTPDELDRYIDVNTRTLLQLSYSFAKHLSNAPGGGMLIISSFAGIWGTNLVAPYGATKAFDWNLGEALHYELKREGVDVLSVCCGAMRTPNYLATEPEYGWMRPTLADPDVVARKSLQQLGKRAVYIPGLPNQLVYFLLGKVLPRTLGTGLINRTMRQMYRRIWR